MPIMKFTASADTTITDAYKPFTLTRAVYANMGAADSLEVYSIYISGSQPQKARALVQFPISTISQSRADGVLPSSGSVKFIFKLYNVEHPETLPTNYYMVINPISSSWEEGYGLDLENLSDTGRTGSKGVGSNWIYRNTSQWNTQGGDFITGNYSKQAYFDNGTEDITVDVTDIIEDQISNIIPPYGLGIYLSGAYEDGTNTKTYYTKRFSARSSEYFYKVPSLEARWEATVKDSRGEFYYSSDNLSDADNLQSVYFYNRINGNLKDLPNNAIPIVNLYNSSGSILSSSIPAVKTKTGTYRCSFAITGSENVDITDVWLSGSKQYFTGSINALTRSFADSEGIPDYVISVNNLKQSYKQTEKPSLRIFIREKDWSPNIYKIANKEIETKTLKNLYYKVYRIVDEFIIIDYGITPIAYTLASFDKNGNYIDLDMSMFEKGYAYGIKFMLLNDTIKTEFPNTFRFKVE